MCVCVCVFLPWLSALQITFVVRRIVICGPSGPYNIFSHYFERPEVRGGGGNYEYNMF